MKKTGVATLWTLLARWYVFQYDKTKPTMEIGTFYASRTVKWPKTHDGIEEDKIEGKIDLMLLCQKLSPQIQCSPSLSTPF